MIDEDTKLKMISAIAKADVTLSLLFLKFGDAVVKLQDCLEYTGFKTVSEANRAAKEGRLSLPSFRMMDSQKACRYVSIHDLAKYIDLQREEANRFNEMMSGKTAKTVVTKPAVRRGRRATKDNHHVMTA